RDKIDRVLWLCPCSVKETIRREFKKHMRDYRGKFVVEGIESLSSSVRLNSRLLKLVRDERIMLVVDESNLVKNHRAKRTINITRLSEYCPYRLILNGTPITRNEADLYAQWYILDWRIFGYRSYWSFSNNHLEYDDYGRIRNILNVDYLVGKMAPYAYQVKKSECLTLPEKTYETTYFHLTDEQDWHYMEIADLLMFEVDEWEPHTIYRLFTGLQNILSGLRITETDPSFKTELFFDDPMENPRMQKLMELVGMDEEKTIIFCTYTHEIKEITKLLNEKYGEDTAVEFYGDLNQKDRQKNLDKFEGRSQYLVANKACAGYGLNLQFCSYVIYYSNDWDYGTRIQSEDRVHRMGQTENVHYIDICAADTLDERILKCLERKENLVDTFKYELENQKDVNILEKYIYYKNRKGRKKVGGVEKESAKAIEELKEGDEIG
ncbi:MAG TPA: DEAD/DEAH box helicase, partial [Clostridia bacterium]|nr:DEAD/DEAH box helicase [Clostridia bacterium]